MKQLIKLFFCTAILISALHNQAVAKTFGTGLSLNQTTPLSKVLESPDTFVGKKIQLKGLIVDVCEKRGCWLSLAGDKPFEKIRVKVTDGEIIFPLEARGKLAVVEGILEKFVLSREEVIARQQHHAEERGESFDPTTIVAGETIYQLRGLGAEIDEI